MDDFIKIGIASVLASAATVMGFKPRLKRIEADVEKLTDDKLNKETFKEVKAHIDTKFKTQEDWLKGVNNKLDTLIERRIEPEK